MIERNGFKEHLLSEIEELKKFQLFLQKRLERAPEGSLNILTKRGGVQQFYHYTGRMQRKYIPKKDLEEAMLLAQKGYDLQALEIIESRISSAEELLGRYVVSVEGLFEKLSPERQNLVAPILMSDEEYVLKWNEKVIGGRNPRRFETEQETENGEIVRSKSEKMIADKLFYEKIPYRYETELQLHGTGVVYPDFAVLNVKTRKTYYWEHFGMMDDEEYCKKALQKLDSYEENGFYPGESLIITMESKGKVIGMRNISMLIDRYLKKADK